MKQIWLIWLFIFWTGTLQATDTLIVGYTPAPPFLIEEKATLPGSNFWLWERIAAEHSFIFIYKQLPFADLLDSLSNAQVDICINPLTITSERMDRFEFTQPYYVGYSSILVHKRGNWAKITGAFSAIFSVNFMGGIFSLMVIIFLFGFILYLVERKHNPDEFRSGIKGLWDGVWWSVVTMTTVGYGDKTPRSSGGKIIAVIWMFVALLFVSGLTASIASNLTVHEMNQKVQRLEDFKAKRVGTVANSSTADYLHNHYFKNIQRFADVNSGLQALLDRDIDAFIYDEAITRYVEEQHPDNERLEFLPWRFGIQLYGFGISKERKALNDHISQTILSETEQLEWRLMLQEYGLDQL